MDQQRRDRMVERFRRANTDEMTFRVKREEVQEGASFSAQAMDEILQQVNLFIGARMIERWERTGEPPTIMDVKVSMAFG